MTATIPSSAAASGLTATRESTRSKRRSVRAKIDSWDDERADRRPMAARRVGLHQNADPVLIRLESRVPEAVETLAEVAPEDVAALGAVYLRAQKVLNGPDSRYVMAMIEDGMHTVVLALRGAGADSAVSKAARNALSEVRRMSCGFVGRREGEVSRHYYARDLGRGVLLSFLALVAVGLLGLVVMRTWLWLPDPEQSWWSVSIPVASMVALRDVLLALGGGAAGAAVSVLLRLNQEPELKFETIAEGAARYRIILGWFFALALLFLVKGGMAANVINDPSATLGEAGTTGSAWVSSWFFWAGLGLLAGFNERWVTHIIARDAKAPARPQGASPQPPPGG